MKTKFRLQKKTRYFLYTLLSLVFAYSIPILGIYFNEDYYKYIYILGSHIIGLLMFTIVYNKYLRLLK